jgi:hypothetical protein
MIDLSVAAFISPFMMQSQLFAFVHPKAFLAAG